jgi:hypothetical protein
VPRTEIVTRNCPKCGTQVRIPVIYESGEYDVPADRPWKLGRGHGCPSGCELTETEVQQLVVASSTKADFS